MLSRDRESFKGSSSTIDQEFTSTPSPSDSAVGDLENVLKEKDSEIVYLRETMEQNEQVIFKVFLKDSSINSLEYKSIRLRFAAEGVRRERAFLGARVEKDQGALREQNEGKPTKGGTSATTE